MMAATALDVTWQRAADGLDERSLRALLAGEIAAVRMEGFASAEECASFCAAIRASAAEARAAETSRMSLIGVNFSNYAGQGKEGYFEQVEPSYRAVAAIAARAGFDPLQRMIERLRAIWPAHVGVALEPEHGRYFAGGIKTRTSSGHLHYDFAPHTAPGFAIAGILDQLGWNLYLDMPRATGATTTWRRPVPREGGAAGRGAARAEPGSQLCRGCGIVHLSAADRRGGHHQHALPARHHRRERRAGRDAGADQLVHRPAAERRSDPLVLKRARRQGTAASRAAWPSRKARIASIDATSWPGTPAAPVVMPTT
jgi:hypothetical protein